MIIMKKFYTILFVLMTFFSATSQVFITELADPNNNANARYIELYNAGQSDVDLSSYRIDKYTNASTTNIKSLNLTGVISAGGFFIIATGPEDTVMFDVYGVTPDQWDPASNHVAGGNGDDDIELYDGNNTLIDQFGVPGIDGTGTCAEFEDGRAERKSSVSSGASTWDESEWNIWADSSVSGCTSHTQAPKKLQAHLIQVHGLVLCQAQPFLLDQMYQGWTTLKVPDHQVKVAFQSMESI